MKTKVLVWVKVNSVTLESCKSDKVWFTAGVKKSRPKDAYEITRDAVKIQEFWGKFLVVVVKDLLASERAPQFMGQRRRVSGCCQDRFPWVSPQFVGPPLSQVCFVTFEYVSSPWNNIIISAYEFIQFYHMMINYWIQYNFGLIIYSQSLVIQPLSVHIPIIYDASLIFFFPI